MKVEKVMLVLFLSVLLYEIDMYFGRQCTSYTAEQVWFSAACVGVFWALGYAILLKSMEYVKHKWVKGGIAILLLAAFIAGTYIFNYFAGNVMYDAIKFKACIVNVLAFSFALITSLVE